MCVVYKLWILVLRYVLDTSWHSDHSSSEVARNGHCRLLHVLCNGMEVSAKCATYTRKRSIWFVRHDDAIMISHYVKTVFRQYERRWLTGGADDSICTEVEVQGAIATATSVCDGLCVCVSPCFSPRRVDRYRLQQATQIEMQIASTKIEIKGRA